ncbi:DUF1294 domain-containing protein [Scandinavium goeteborgense]|uniref:Uncharacterized membrane protein YsdA (DUF1294 family) n=1 Tax=Scandinavium goeteborgense TaxID=1851514 RepID=A0A4R6EN95_SCAGO|nr:DUF1294 domain-containing protein [Scandinavium goeteborgense]TDN60665.1 uncharacterized membrane protein YsdA (DUF1294 family) [Scandinavium goeteborgense]
MKLHYFYYAIIFITATTSALLPDSLTVWVISVNVLTLLLYGADKLAARKNGYRIPELTLLIFGVVGGWFGAILGQQIFRHKTQKQPFKTYFSISVIVNLMVVIAGMYWVMR